MTISYPITLHGTLADIALATLTARNVVGMSESPFTLEQQVYQHQGQRWELTVELNPLVRAAADPWIAWLTSLMGRYGTFSMGDPTGVAPRGSGGGTPQVAVDSQTGFTLQIYGATSSAVNWLRAGDYVMLSTSAVNRLYRNLQNVNTTSGGVATLDLWPRLRLIPNSGETVAVNSTVGLWRLQDDSVVWNIRPPGIYEIIFSAVEALP